VTVTWRRWADLSADEFFEIARLRSQVFVLEQRITVEDLDDVDRHPETWHVFSAESSGAATAYLRVLRLDRPDHGATVSFGRVAVHPAHRGQGLAQRLIADVVARVGDEAIVIHSQAYVTGLYASFGFVEVGEPFVEADIPHRSMLRHGDQPQGR